MAVIGLFCAFVAFALSGLGLPVLMIVGFGGFGLWLFRVLRVAGFCRFLWGWYNIDLCCVCGGLVCWGGLDVLEICLG